MQHYKEVLRVAASLVSLKRHCVCVCVCVCAYIYLNTQSLLKIVLVITLILEVRMLGKATYGFYLNTMSFYSEHGFLESFQNHKCKLYMHL